MPADNPYKLNADVLPSTVRAQDIETAFLSRLEGLKYSLRPDIRDRASLEKSFREKFEALNQVKLTDSEFARLLDEIITPDVEKNDFNLNISRYISTAVAEEEIDLAKTHQELVDIEKKIADATEKHNAFLKELGLPLLPYPTSKKQK